MELPLQFHKPARYNIRRLVSKLRRRSPIRLWLESYGEISEGSASTLFQAMASTAPGAWTDHAVAFHILGLIELAPLERELAKDLLLKALNKPDVERITLERFLSAVGCTFLGWFALACLFPMSLEVIIGALVLSVFTSPILLAIQEQTRAEITRRVAATSLTHAGNPECLVALWKQVRPTSGVFEEAFATLKALLPDITSDWYGRLPAGCNAALVEMARSPYTDLALPALDALERAGDGSSAKAVARIVERAPNYYILTRATAVLPTLIARREREEASSTLLRPSAGVRTDDLVRPVYGVAPDVTNLLRASHAERHGNPNDDADP